LAQPREQNEIAQRQLQDLRRLGNSQAIKAANGQLAAAKGRYQNAAAMLSYSEIRSPIDGVVTDRPLYPGELAAANQPLMTVMDTSKLIAKTHIAQAAAQGEVLTGLLYLSPDAEDLHAHLNTYATAFNKPPWFNQGLPRPNGSS